MFLCDIVAGAIFPRLRSLTPLIRGSVDVLAHFSPPWKSRFPAPETAVARDSVRDGSYCAGPGRKASSAAQQDNLPLSLPRVTRVVVSHSLLLRMARQIQTHQRCAGELRSPGPQC